jgi:hypothetical protein
MTAKTRLLAVEKRMNLGPLPKDLRDATNEQLAQIIGVDKERFAAMTDEELQEIINGGIAA